MRTTRFWNNLHQVRSRSMIGKPILFKTKRLKQNSQQRLTSTIKAKIKYQINLVLHSFKYYLYQRYIYFCLFLNTSIVRLFFLSSIYGFSLIIAYNKKHYWMQTPFDLIYLKSNTKVKSIYLTMLSLFCHFIFSRIAVAHYIPISTRVIVPYSL